MKKVAIPNGKCVVHNLSINYLDGSLCGVETIITAQGLTCVNGAVEPFLLEEQDTAFRDFLEEHKDFTFYSYGSVRIVDELNYVDVNMAPVSFDKYKAMFPELADVALPLESYLSDVYSEMRKGFPYEDWAIRNVLA